MITTKSNLKFSGGPNWRAILEISLAVALCGLAGGVLAWLMQPLSGREASALLALMGAGLLFLLCVIQFKVMVLLTFCLFGLVRIEPAPVDGLLMMLLAVGLVTGRLSLTTLKGSPFIHLMVWFFLVINFVSLLGVVSFFDSLRFLLITVYLVALTYFVKMYITSLPAMRQVMVGYLVSAIGSAGLVAAGFLNISPFTELFLQDGTRAMGAFKDPNVFGPFLIMAIILLIDEFFYPQLFQGWRWVKLAAVFLLSSVAFLSFSRAVWGCLALAMVVYFGLLITATHQPQNVKLIRRSLGGILLAGLVSAFMFTSILRWVGLEQFFEWRTSNHSYDAVRFTRQWEGVEAGLTHLFGMGPGTWNHAHSLYARTFAEHGVFGLAAILFFLLMLLISAGRLAVQNIGKPYGLSARVIVACLASLLLNSAVIDTIHWRHFWLTCALAWVISSKSGAPAPVKPNQNN